MLPTPDLSHLTKDDFDQVYEPAEDTFILLDALEQDADELRNLSARVCLEIGYAQLCFAQTKGFSGVLPCLAQDQDVSLPSSDKFWVLLVAYISPLISTPALLSARSRLGSRTVPIENISTSLTGPLAQRLQHQVDVLLFNPPYVPTLSEEAREGQGYGGIQGSWAGGQDGMEVTNNVLDSVTSLLSEKGRFYLVAVKANNTPSIQRKLAAQDMDSDIVLQRRAGREHLFVLRFQRRHTG